MIALGNLADSRAVEPLIEKLKDENEAIRLATIMSLVQIGEPAVEPMILAMNDEVSEVRGGVANALGQLKEERAVPSFADSPEGRG